MTGIPYTPIDRFTRSWKLLLDNDPQEAASYNAILQDLIDGLNYVAKRSTDNVGSPASVMQEVTDAVSGVSTFHVLGVGTFIYSSTGLYSQTIPKFSYPAIGMGVGAWVNEIWYTLMGQSTNTKLLDEVLPYTQLLAFSAATKSTYVDQLVNNSTFATTQDNSASALSLTIGSLLASDKLDISVGPLEVFAYAADTVQLRVRIRQNNSGGTPVDAIYLRQVTGPTGGITIPVEFPIYYQSISDADATVYVEHRNGGSLSSAIQSPAQPSSQWGASGFQWIRYKQYRVM